MRKLWIVVGALFLICVATMVTAALSLNRLIAGTHDRIIEKAQAALGREVGVARITVRLWGGLGVRLDDIRIADDPRFGNQDFVHIPTLTVRAKLWPLLHQHFEVSRIVVTQPRINMIRNASGEWNYASVRPLLPADTSALATAFIPVANTAPAPPPEPAARPYAVRNVNITDGTFTLVDGMQAPVRTTQVAHVDATLHFAAPTSPIEVSVAAAVAADTPNIDVHGSIGPLDGHTDIPMQFDGTVGPVALGPAALGAPVALIPRIDELHVVASVTRTQLHVNELTGRALGGAFTLGGDYPLQAGAAAALKGTVRDLDLAAVSNLETGNGASRLGGKAHLIIDVSGTGTTREAIEASLTGRVVADIHEGVIRQLNIANEVLGKASRLPVVGAVVSEKIKPKYPRLFADPDTHFETLHGVFTIGDRRAQTDDLTMATAEYGVLGRGWIAFNRQADLACRLRMSKRFSDDVVGDVHAAKYLLDDDAQLAIPFHLRGELDKAKPNLDNDDIMALVQRGAVRGGAKDLLDKFFGAAPQATPGERKNPLAEGLRHLFGR